jgi:hypothetical protein
LRQGSHPEHHPRRLHERVTREFPLSIRITRLHGTGEEVAALGVHGSPIAESAVARKPSFPIAQTICEHARVAVSERKVARAGIFPTSISLQPAISIAA